MSIQLTIGPTDDGQASFSLLGLLAADTYVFMALPICRGLPSSRRAGMGLADISVSDPVLRDFSTAMGVLAAAAAESDQPAQWLACAASGGSQRIGGRQGSV